MEDTKIQINSGILKEDPIQDVYNPSFEEQQYIQEAYELFTQDRTIKTGPQDILNGLELQQIWDEADKEYNIFFPQTNPDGWSQTFTSLISQDKINEYWAKVYSQLMDINFQARNSGRSIDRIMSRVCQALHDYSMSNDGRPTDSGYSKFLRQGLQCMKYGTVHTMHYWNGERCEKEIFPNEEVFIPNFYEFDLQKQGHFIRLKDGMTYEEAKAKFGKLENFKYVKKGAFSQWSIGTTPWFRNYQTGIVQADRCQVLFVWKPVSPENVTKGKRQKYFNIIINGVLMFKPDNKDVFKHGLYPITKRVCDLFDGLYYWGKPIYLRFKADKTAYDQFRSDLLNRGKLALDRPMVSLDGLHVDEKIIVPGKITAISDDINGLKAIPGVGDPLTSGDFNILSLLKSNINDSATQSVLPGQGKKSARQAQIEDANVNSVLSTIGLLTAFDFESEAYITVRNALQFFPKSKIKKLVVTDQQLSNGKNGDFEILFEKIPPMTEAEQLSVSTKMLQQQDQSSEEGDNKEFAMIDIEYIDEIDIMTIMQSNPADRPTQAQKQNKAITKFGLYSKGQNFNQEAVSRQFVRDMGDNEDELVMPTPPPQQQSDTVAPNIPGVKSALSATNQLGGLQ